MDQLKVSDEIKFQIRPDLLNTESDREDYNGLESGKSYLDQLVHFVADQKHVKKVSEVVRKPFDNISKHLHEKLAQDELILLINDQEEQSMYVHQSGSISLGGNRFGGRGGGSGSNRSSSEGQKNSQNDSPENKTLTKDVGDDSDITVEVIGLKERKDHNVSISGISRSPGSKIFISTKPQDVTESTRIKNETEVEIAIISDDTESSTILVMPVIERSDSDDEDDLIDIDYDNLTIKDRVTGATLFSGSIIGGLIIVGGSTAGGSAAAGGTAAGGTVIAGGGSIVAGGGLTIGGVAVAPIVIPVVVGGCIVYIVGIHIKHLLKERNNKGGGGGGDDEDDDKKEEENRTSSN